MKHWVLPLQSQSHRPGLKIVHCLLKSLQTHFQMRTCQSFIQLRMFPCQMRRVCHQRP